MSKIDHWNYRVIHDEKNDVHIIVTSYYSAKNKVVLIGKEAYKPIGKTLSELKEEMKLMMLAFDFPVISKKLIEKEVVEHDG